MRKRSVLPYVGNLAPVMSGLLTAPLTARSLGVTNRGELAALLLVSTGITVIGAFGLAWLARADVAARPELARVWARLGVRAGLVFAPFAMVAAAAAAASMQLSVGETIAVTVLFLFAALSSSRAVTANILVSLGQSNRFALANLAMTLTVLLVIVVAFLLHHLTLAVALSANAAGFVVQSLLLARGFRVAVRNLTTASRHGDGFEGRLTLRVVIPRAFRSWSSQLSELGASRADVIVMTSQAASSQLGLYSVVALIPQMTYTVYSTVIQQSYARNPSAPLRHRTTVLWLTCFLVGLAISVAAFPIAYFLIPIVFGDNFSGARTYLPLALAVTVSLALVAPVTADSALRRRPAPMLLLSVLVIVLVGCLVGVSLGAFVALPVLAILLTIMSTVYILILNRGDLRWLRLRNIRELFKTS